MKPRAVVPDSSHGSESITGTSGDVDVEKKVASRPSKQQQPQQSTVDDARSKFEQVLRASRQTATAATSVSVPAESMSVHKKLPSTDDSAVVSRCPNPENALMSSLQYSQLVYALSLLFFYWMSLCFCFYFSGKIIFYQWSDTVGRQAGHPACKKLSIDLLMVTIWLELCTAFGSRCYHHFLHPYLQSCPEWRHSGTSLLGLYWKMSIKWVSCRRHSVVKSVMGPHDVCEKFYADNMSLFNF